MQIKNKNQNQALLPKGLQTVAMKRYLLRVLLSLLMLSNGFTAKATHLTGGDLTYTWYKGNFFILKFNVFRDCSKASNPALDASIDYKVFLGSDSTKTYGSYTANLYSKTSVLPSAPHCLTPSGYCLQQGVYIDTIALGNDSVGYHILWLRGNRNAAVVNIYVGSPAPTVGSVWHAFVPPVKYHNSSPQFLSSPLPYQCVGKQSCYNQDVSDPDHDSLVFSTPVPYVVNNSSGIPTPSMSLIANAKYNSGYSVTKPFGTIGSAISIDPITGTMCDSPTATGEYVVAVSIKEYRYDPVYKKSVYLGEIRRDYQYFVSSCAASTNKPPIFDADTLGQTRKIDPDSSLCFNISGHDPNATDTVFLWATAGVFSTSPNSKSPFATFPGDTGWKGKYSGFTTPEAMSTFCWTPGCNQITYTSPYLITFNLADNGCNVVQKVYKIYVNPRPILSGPTMYCADILSATQNKLTFKPIVPAKGSFLQYKLYRMADTESTYSLVDSSTTSTITSWTDKNVKNGLNHYYSYYITTENSCNLEGVPSDTISTLHLNYSLLSDKKVSFSWNKQKSGKIYYRLLADQGGGFKQMDSTTSLSYTLTSCSETLKMKIQVGSDSGKCTSTSNTTPSIVLKDVTAPNIANKLINASFTTSNYVNLTFNASDSNDVSYYYIYRGTGTTYVKIDSVKYVKGQKSYTYLDKTLTNPTVTKYYYEIKAKDSCGNISASGNLQSPVTLSGKAGELRATLTWKKYQGYTIDTVQVQKLTGSTWTTLKYAATTDSSYIDSVGNSCNVKQNYRILVRESAGNNQFSYSDSVMVSPFDTIAPAEVNLKNVSVKNNSSITITWDKVADKDVKRYNIYTSKNGSAFSFLTGYNVTTAATTFTYTETGINTQKDTFSFRVYAADSCGPTASKTSETHTAVMLSDTGGPLSAYLKWSYYSGFTVKNYTVQKLSGKVWKDLATLSDTAHVYTDTASLQCNIKYYYRIKITENGGDLQTSYSDSALAIPYDTVHPSNVNILSASVKNKNAIDVKFNKVPDLRVKDYEIEYFKNGSATASFVAKISLPFASPYTYTDTSARPDSNTYCYQVFALDSCGGAKSKASELHCPSKIAGTALDNSNRITWNKYSGYVTGKYYIQRWNGTTYVDIANVDSATTSYTDTGLNCNVARVYRIRGVETGGTGQQSYSDTISLTPYDTVSPARVDMLVATVKDSLSINVTFKKVADKDVKKYEIFSSVNGGAYSLLTTINTPFISPYTYTNTGLKTTKNTYSYKVIAVDSCMANASKSFEVHTPVLLKGKAKDLSSALAWTGYKGFAVDSYTVQRWIGNKWVNIKSVDSSVRSYTDTPASCNVTRYYRIKTAEKGGASQISYSDTINVVPFDTVRPDVPSIHSVSLTNDSTIYLSWTKVKATDVKQYIVFRQAPSGGPFTAIDTTNIDTFFTDKFASKVTGSYSYKIVAMDSCALNKSAPSIYQSSIYETSYTTGCKQQIVVKWNPYVNWGGGVNKYEIYRSTNGGAEVLAGTVSAPQDTFTDITGVNPRDIFTYRILADEKGTTYASYSQKNTNKTFNPATPSILYASKTASSSAFGQITIKWTAQNTSATPYIKYHNIYYKKVGGAGFALLQSNIPVSKDSIVQTGVNTLSDDYEYYVTATDSCGNISDTSVIHKTMNLKLSVIQLVHKLKWTPYIGWPVKKYIVQLQVGAKWTNFDSVPGTVTNYTRFPAPCYKVIFYRIIAKDSTGNYALSDTSGGEAIDSQPPNKATFKNATVLTGKAAKLTFRGSDSLDMYEYAILRSNDAGTVFNTAGSMLFTTPGAALSFVDSVNTMNDYHRYVILSLDSCLNSAPSDTFATIQLRGLAQNLQNRLFWKPFQGYPVDSYYVKIYSGGTWTTLAQLKSTDSFYVHTPLNCGVARTYKIFATELGGLRTTLSDSITLTPFDTTAPPAPIEDYATVIDSNTIYFQWEKAVSKVKKYEVSLKSTNGAWNVITTLTNKLNYKFKGLDAVDSGYSMRIVAIDSCAGNRSLPGIIHSPILLKPKAMDQSVQLNWSAYQGFTVKQYIISRWNGVSWTKIDSTNNSTLTYTDKPLACNVKQFYKITAFDNTGKFLTTSDSVHATPFDTIKPPATTLNYATILPNHNIKVSWQWNTATDVKYFEVWRKKDAGAFTKLATVTYDSSYTDATTNPQLSTYSYYVVVVDSCSNKNISPSSDTDKVMFMTSHTGGCKPFATIYWTPFTSLPNGTSSYEIYKSTGAGFSHLTSVTGTSTSYTDSSVLENKTYCYHVVAVDSKSGFSSSSDSICVTPYIFPRPLSIATKVVSVVSSGTTTGSVQIQWNKRQKGDTFAIAYRIYHATTENGPYAMVHEETDTNKTSYIQTGINTVSQNHFYYVVTVNVCDLEAFPIDTHKTVVLSVANRSLEADLLWNKYYGFKVSGYEVYRSVNGAASQLLVKKIPTDTSLKDLNIRCGQNYSYKIKALSATGIYSWSDSVTVTGVDSTPPRKADIFYASVTSTDTKTGTIDIGFNAANDINRKGYMIYRQDGGSGAYNLLQTINDTFSTGLTFTDSKLNTYKSQYSYYITTFDSCGNIAMPSDTHTTVLLSAVPVNNMNLINWTSYVGFTSYSYKLERMSSSNPTWKTLGIINSGITNFSDSSITCHVKYTYRITVTDGNSSYTSYSNIDTATGIRNIPPVHPYLVLATVTKTDINDGNILLEWHPSVTTGIATYFIYRSADGLNWRKVATVPGGDTTYTDNFFNTYEQNYYYRIEAYDSCGNISSDPGFTNTHRTIGLTTHAGNSETDISWNQYTGFPVAKYKLYRDGQVWATFTDTTSRFVDTLVICGRMYHYTMVGVSADSTLQTLSNRDSVVTIDHKAPRAVHIVTATVDSPNLSILVRWTRTTNYDALKYVLYRKYGDIGNYTIVHTTTNLSDTMFIDTLQSFGSKPHCYMLQVVDYCDNHSPESNQGCTIYLTGKSDPLIHTLNWTPYKKWGRGVMLYNIYRKEDSSEWKLIAKTDSTTYTYKDENLTNFVKDHCYQIEAVEVNGYFATSKSNTICLQQPPIIFMPNAFSPGTTPGINDSFGPKGTFFGVYDLRIYDRWGELIYRTTSGIPWDGRAMGGVIAPEGVYMYEITVPDYHGLKQYRFSGTVQIIK